MDAMTSPENISPLHAKNESQQDADVIYTLRTVHQHHTQLLIMADQKANILIGVVTIVLTILFANSSYLLNAHMDLRLPMGLFVSTEAVAMFIAFMVIMPRTVARQKFTDADEMPNPMFFGFYANIKEDDYLDFLCRDLCDNNSARKYLARNLYQLGLVLKKKYRMLSIAYAFAILGVFISLISAFLVAVN